METKGPLKLLKTINEEHNDVLGVDWGRKNEKDS